MSNYQCNVCHHIYEVEKGDPLHGVASGTSFDALPEDWVCPVCGVGKSHFHALEESSEPCEVTISK